MRQAGHGARIEKLRILFRKLQGKRPNERQKRRWEDNIKMDLREIGCEGVY
jgi:hypothetical protein